MHNLTDKLGYLNQTEVATAAFSVIDRLQTLPPAVQVQALATVYLLMLQVLDINPREELTRAENIMKDADRRLDYKFKAVQQYIEEELRGKL